MGKLVRATDWSKTPLGAIDTWPQSLRTAVSLCLASNFPISLAWGSEHVQIYNDGYWPLCGAKHPRSMGQDFTECWAAPWPVIGVPFERALSGQASYLENQRMFLDRNGYLEETFFTFSFSPVHDETGGIGGLFHPVTETTGRMLAERRTRALRDLASDATKARTIEEAFSLTTQILSDCVLDLPFALIYLVDAGANQARLVASTKSAPSSLAKPTVDLRSSQPLAGPLAEALRTNAAQQLDDLEAHFGAFGSGPYPETPKTALVLPITPPGAERPLAVLVAGVSARLPLDDAYRAFYDLVAAAVTASVASARAYEEQRQRAEQLAELDRLKTAFFSNVSHEFRTPLTLMIGPTEDALASPRGALHGASLDTVYRNELRLLKLVNSLLDFSRIEAGRVDTACEETDLPRLTADLASQFRAAIERAGLRFVVDTPALPLPAFVDREMWEKIVLNLLSNALKYTFAGEVALRLRMVDETIELTVRDTGVGIAADELPRVFERFHRVRGARARSHEGTGIGLTLVRDLVKLHGGSVEAQSELDIGSCFTVTIPRGASRARRPPPTTMASTAIAAAAYVNEALSWLPSTGETPARETGAGAAARAPGARRARIVLADDNADMRQYLGAILSKSWAVETVADGRQALDAIRREPPDLLMSDVMMPQLDGFELTHAVRGDPSTHEIPIILVSARAGDEEASDGLAAGANDYIVKPFSARELIARVKAQLEIARAHQLVKSHSEAARMRLHTFLMQAPAAIAVLRGAQLVYELANEQYLKSVRGRDVIGKPGRQALPELVAQGVWDIVDRVYRTGEPFTAAEFPAQIDRQGTGALEQCYFDWVAQPTRDADGIIDGVMICNVEVTERVLSRRQLERAGQTEQELRQVAESASRAKDEFLAVLGHELRNPLAPILTALELMRLRNSDAVIKERTVIERQTQHLVGLVDDLLDVARITRGKVQLKLQRLELSGIVANAIEIASPLLEERLHKLVVEVPASGLAVDADPQRLAQILANLLTNAAKYTEPGGRIRLTAAREADEIIIRVRDTGIGIAPAMLPKVFDLFVQERQGLDRSQGGLGLGLAIVRSLVRQHGGSVEVNSEGRDRGTEFAVRLPAAARALGASAGATATASQPHRDGRRVLVVDDNADAAAMLAECLEIMGHTTRVVLDGPAALAAVGQFAPDIALLDIGLPVMDGYELARRLRELTGFQRLPLVAVTGYGQEADRQRALAAGFDAHVVKPTSADRVGSVISKLTAQRPSG